MKSEGRNDPNIAVRPNHPNPQKAQQNRMSSPSRSKTTPLEFYKQLKMKHLRAKNKSIKTGILVSLNSLELKVDRRQKTRPGQSRAFTFNREVSRGKSRHNPFPPKTLHQKLPRGEGHAHRHRTEPDTQSCQCRQILHRWPPLRQPMPPRILYFLAFSPKPDVSS